MAHRCDGLRAPDRDDDGPGCCCPWLRRSLPRTSPGFHAGHPIASRLRAWCRSLRCPESEATPTLAPDGDHVAFTWSGTNQDNFDIYVQRIGSGTEQRRTVHPERDFSPAWSPDGQWIAFLRGGAPGPSKVMLVPPHGGRERSLGEIHIRQPYTVPPYLAWFPDGKALVVVNSPAPDKPDALFVISIDTLEREALSSPASDTFDMAPAVSPDGRTVAFTRGHGELYVLGIGDDRRAATPQRRLAESGPLA